MIDWEKEYKIAYDMLKQSDETILKLQCCANCRDLNIRERDYPGEYSTVFECYCDYKGKHVKPNDVCKEWEGK